MIQTALASLTVIIIFSINTIPLEQSGGICIGAMQ